MDQFALQVDGRAFRILEGDFETLATKYRHTDESIRCILQDSDLANDGTEVGIVRGTAIPTFIAKLDPLGRVPKMLFKLEVLHSGRIGQWKIASTVDGSEITKALTVEWIIRRLARLLQERIRTIAGTSKE